MSAFIAGLLAGAIFGPLIGLALAKLVKAKTPRPQKHGKYGHPWAPVPELKKRLPKPPSGFFWEIRVEHDRGGTPYLHLALIDAAKGAAESETKQNLVMGQHRPWSEDYRRYSSIKGRIFDNDLIGPMVDWATAAANRNGNANQMREYITEADF